ncbi:hypothetical protein ACFO5K_13150 [Nocardia halotolerans]|uniref:Uncharacterized protein n=1 Tax=Nocardia halotolerans TaxID=1755878 RepID=A0ABV8VH14_9NOCA
MDIHAFPTGAHTPVDQAEAAGIADRHLPTAAPGTERRIVEFAQGFTVHVVDPTHAPPDRPVVVPGSVYVIDKATAAVSCWPTYPSELVAEQYAHLLRTGRLIVADEWPEQD